MMCLGWKIFLIFQVIGLKCTCDFFFMAHALLIKAHCIPGIVYTCPHKQGWETRMSKSKCTNQKLQNREFFLPILLNHKSEEHNPILSLEVTQYRVNKLIAGHLKLLDFQREMLTMTSLRAPAVLAKTCFLGTSPQLSLQHGLHLASRKSQYSFQFKQCSFWHSKVSIVVVFYYQICIHCLKVPIDQGITSYIAEFQLLFLFVCLFSFSFFFC